MKRKKNLCKRIAIVFKIWYNKIVFIIKRGKDTVCKPTIWGFLNLRFLCLIRGMHGKSKNGGTRR